MAIDEQTLNTERLLLKKEFDTLSDKIRQFELNAQGETVTLLFKSSKWNIIAGHGYVAA